jgi:hypothetical protein
MMRNVVARASQLAVGQWGLLTTAQAAREGITRLQLARLTDAGVLERLGRGVYATTSSADEHLGLRAAWLALDPARTAEERLKSPTTTGVVSHASAAGLHNLGDLLDDEHEFTLPQRKQTRRAGIRVHRGDLTEQDVTIVEGLPVTTEERTIADLLRAGNDPEHVAQIIGQGVRRGVVDLTDLAVHLDPLARRHNQPDGGGLVEYLLDLVGLSHAALARDLAKTSTGQELIAAGRLSAIEAITTALANAGPGLALPHLQPFDGVTLSPSTLATIARVASTIGKLSPEMQTVVAAAQSPTTEAARRWLESSQGQQAYRAATRTRHTEGEETDG